MLRGVLGLGRCGWVLVGLAALLPAAPLSAQVFVDAGGELVLQAPLVQIDSDVTVHGVLEAGSAPWAERRLLD